MPCLNVSPAFLAKGCFYSHLQDKRLFSVSECGDCGPGTSGSGTLVLNTHSPLRESLYSFLCPRLQPRRPGCCRTRVCGDRGPRRGVDLVFWVRMLIPRNKGQGNRKEGNRKIEPGFLSPVHCGMAASSWKVVLESSGCSGVGGQPTADPGVGGR